MSSWKETSHIRLRAHSRFHLNLVLPANSTPQIMSHSQVPGFGTWAWFWRDNSIHIPGTLFLLRHMQIPLKPNTEHELTSLVAAEMMLRGRPDQESVVSDREMIQPSGMSGPHITPTWEQRSKLRLRVYLAGQTHKEVSRMEWNTPAKIGKKLGSCTNVRRSSFSRLLLASGWDEDNYSRGWNWECWDFLSDRLLYLLQFLPRSQSSSMKSQRCFLKPLFS